MAHTYYEHPEETDSTFYVCESDLGDGSDVLMFEHDVDQNVTRYWYADANEQVRIARWLTECNATLIVHWTDDQSTSTSTTWQCEWPSTEQINTWLADDAEYDAFLDELYQEALDDWADEQYQAMQDSFALEQDSLDHW